MNVYLNALILILKLNILALQKKQNVYQDVLIMENIILKITIPAKILALLVLIIHIFIILIIDAYQNVIILILMIIRGKNYIIMLIQNFSYNLA